MKKLSLVLINLLFLFLCIPVAHAAVITSPSNIAMSRGSQTTATFAYRISNTSAGDNHSLATSSSGEFKSGTTSLGVINNAISVMLFDPGTGIFTGKTSETVILSTGVIKRAEQLKVNTFQFERNFILSGGAVPSYSLTSVVTINVKTAGDADFSIKRLRLYFENNRGEITVKRQHQALKAYADISFVGTGLLQGYWQVDDRLISHVNRHLTPGNSITLETPGTPELPTVLPGTHVITFVMSKPEQNITLPKAIYYVTPDEVEKMGPVVLVAPANADAVTLSRAEFRWAENKGAEAFLIEFIDDDAERPVFSAFTEQSEYKLPAAVLKYYFSNTETYLWRIKAFDSEYNMIAKSPVWEFRLKK